MTEQHTCPRRAENGHDDPDSPFADSGTDLDTWRPASTGPSCSYCGSLHPDRFMELVRDGWIVGPTDKSYKAYLGTEDSGTRAKFYFQHLSEEQQDEFIALHNAKQMRVGYPGHFYQLPFFASRAGA